MNNNKMHMVPQVVIDCAENFVSAKNPDTRLTYESRLVAIKEYCDYMLTQHPFTNTVHGYGNKRARK